MFFKFQTGNLVKKPNQQHFILTTKVAVDLQVAVVKKKIFYIIFNPNFRLSISFSKQKVAIFFAIVFVSSYHLIQLIFS